MNFGKNIQVLATPGHTPESMSLLYEENGIKYACAGDAVREDVIRKNAPTVMYSKKEYFESVKKIFSLADVIIPGHGRIIKGKILAELKEMMERC